MRSAAAFPTEVVAQPSVRICSVKWCEVKNTALRTTFLAAPTPRLRESIGARACTSVCSSSSAIEARMSPGAAVRSANRSPWSCTRSTYSWGKSVRRDGLARRRLDLGALRFVRERAKGRGAALHIAGAGTVRKGVRKAVVRHG